MTLMAVRSVCRSGKEKAMSNIKRCPFCGGKAIFIYDNDFKDENGENFHIGHIECVRCEVTQKYEGKKGIMIKQWNRRAEVE